MLAQGVSLNTAMLALHNSPSPKDSDNDNDTNNTKKQTPYHTVDSDLIDVKSNKSTDSSILIINEESLSPASNKNCQRREAAKAENRQDVDINNNDCQEKDMNNNKEDEEMPACSKNVKIEVRSSPLFYRKFLYFRNFNCE